MSTIQLLMIEVQHLWCLQHFSFINGSELEIFHSHPDGSAVLFVSIFPPFPYSNVQFVFFYVGVMVVKSLHLIQILPHVILCLILFHHFSFS